MHKRLLMRSLLLAGALVAGMLVAGSAGADPAPQQAMLYLHQAGIFSGETNSPAEGVSARTPVYSPDVADNESTGFEIELSAETPGANPDAITLGWELDPVQFPAPDPQPHLVINHRVDGKDKGYKGFKVAPNAPYKPGAVVLPDPSFAREWSVVYSADRSAWLIALDKKLLGSFPAKLWPASRFKAATLVQVGGVVDAKTDHEPCSGMGNNEDSSSSTSAFVFDTSAIFFVGTNVNSRPLTEPLPNSGFQSRYTVTEPVTDPSGTSFHYGGPNGCNLP